MPQSLPNNNLDNQLEQFVKNEKLNPDNETIEIVNVEKEENDLMVRQQSFDKSRRSLSMLHPSQKEQLSKLMVEGYDEKDSKKENNKQKKLIQEIDDIEKATPNEGINRRMTIGDKDFYDNRPNNTIFIETSKEQDERVRKNSPFGGLKTWRLIKLIVKSNDDVRQE